MLKIVIVKSGKNAFKYVVESESPTEAETMAVKYFTQSETFDEFHIPTIQAKKADIDLETRDNDLPIWELICEHESEEGKKFKSTTLFWASTFEDASLYPQEKQLLGEPLSLKITNYSGYIGNTDVQFDKEND